VCANCLHSFTDGGEGLKIRGIGVKAKVKAKVKGKSEDMELKSKGRKGNQAVVRCFSLDGEGSEGKKREIIVYARNARTRAREKWIDRGALLFGLGVERGRRFCPSPR